MQPRFHDTHRPRFKWQRGLIVPFLGIFTTSSPSLSFWLLTLLFLFDPFASHFSFLSFLSERMCVFSLSLYLSFIPSPLSCRCRPFVCVTFIISNENRTGGENIWITTGLFVTWKFPSKECFESLHFRNEFKPRFVRPLVPHPDRLLYLSFTKINLWTFAYTTLYFLRHLICAPD